MTTIIVLGLILGIIGLLTFFIWPTNPKKTITSPATTTTQKTATTSSFWKRFISFLKFFWGWRFVSFVILGLFIWFFFPQLKLWFKFKGVERAQIAKAIRPLETRLDVLAEKAKNGEGLSDKEAVEMQSLKKEIVAAKKKVKEGPPLPQKPASAKPKEEVWDWTFRWERNDRQWEEAKKAGRKKKGEEYPARLLEITPSQLTMEYISGYSGKAKKVVLGVGNTGDFWAADYFVKNKNPKEIDLSLKVSLYKDPESPGNFTGIFWQDQDGQQVDCWLSKK